VVSGAIWSPDGKFLVSCGWDTTIRLWDLTSLTSFPMFEDPSTGLLSMALGQNGSLLACGTYLRGVQVWDVTARRLLWVGQPQQAAFLSLGWGPDGVRLAGGGSDGNVYLWETTNGDGQEPRTVPTRLQGHHGLVKSVAWSPDGTKLVSGSGNRD